MGEFLEERFPHDINYGSGFRDIGAARTVNTFGGDEYRSLDHPFVRCALDVEFSRQKEEVIGRIIDLNRRANGTFRGFRVYNYNDFSTNAYTQSPTAFDQPMQLVSDGVYQMVRWYGNWVDAKCARRIIRKPAAGTTLVGVGGQILPSAQWSVDTTTGIVTLATGKAASITGITKASQAVVTVGANTFLVGESVVFSDVAGMTEINGLRALITAKPTSTTIQVAINSALFSDYLNSGTVQTRPTAGEAATCGCVFDIPMRFDADLSGTFIGPGVLGTSVGIREILNP
jgi:uncharacterized protein (TIGR02217 family)